MRWSARISSVLPSRAYYQGSSYLARISLTTVVRNFTSSGFGSEEVVIVSAVRTPMGSFNGAFSSLKATDLASIAVKEAVDRVNGLSGNDVEEVILGNVLNSGVGQAPSRQAALGAGMGTHVPCTDVNKVCASGMKSIMFAAQSIMLGMQKVVVAGGFESMSNVPFLLRKSVPLYGHAQLEDGLLGDGLWDVYNNIHMGKCGEKCAQEYGITREEQDAFALRSYDRAQNAISEGLFKDEIVPVEISGKRGSTVRISDDEEPSKLKKDKLPTLKSAFQKDGTITAANASKLNDGACALVLMSASEAKVRGLQPLAKILGFADAARDPIDFTIAPALAVPPALKRANVTPEDVDLHEINEAFSVVTLANMKLLNISEDKVNVKGGAVALGHPIGCSGARIVTSLVHTLKQRGSNIGVASICNGGGGASAIVIERL